jgi:hypothetical protein
METVSTYFLKKQEPDNCTSNLKQSKYKAAINENKLWPEDAKRLLNSWISNEQEYLYYTNIDSTSSINGW